ncbi:MAG: type II CRISPR RNA-guided endonuclease Cas9, partial [Rickettsiales bacterium]|nr:type II CRISPR RNA-guided endonuclease Cas9 [Rickettsiales bacterium]
MADKKKKIFGFDLGIASIGWAVVELSGENTDPGKGAAIKSWEIVGTGVRVFSVAENPKDGSSLAAKRRSARLSRRSVRRKKLRISEIRKLLAENNMPVFLLPQSGDIDVWELRAKHSFERKLSANELARVLVHLAKHRGFKSVRKVAEEADSEGGKVLKAIRENKDLLENDNNKTLAQVIFERYSKKRNRGKVPIKDKDGNPKKNSKGDVLTENYYGSSIPRDEIEREVDMIYSKQSQYGLFTEDLCKKYKEIAFRQRGIAPVEKMVNFCLFEESEKCAPKESPTAELFVALTIVNNTCIFDENGKKRFLSREERNKIIELLKEIKEVKYSTLRKHIFPKETDVKFCNVSYVEDKAGKKTNPENKRFYLMCGWHKLKGVLENVENYSIELLDRIMTVIAMEKDDDRIEKGLEKLGISSVDIEKLLKITTAKFINLSLKALYKIVPEMKMGLSYDKTCEVVGYDFRKIGDLGVAPSKLLSVIPQEKLTKNPVVNRTVAQFRKVYNAMVREFGEPDQINLEIGRKLKKTYEERREITLQNQKSYENRQRAAVRMMELGLNVSDDDDVLKYLLYEQQNGKCIYSGKSLKLENLCDYDIDHILPYSRSLDNSFKNKVLCLREENQRKSNKTAAEYMKSKDSDKWHEFKEWVNTMNLGRKKKDNLLNETFNEESELKFKERNGSDNAYVARFVSQYLKLGIDFSQSRFDIKQRIQVRTGFLTDYLRHQWGLDKSRDESDRHHAQDAIIIACATQGMVEYLSRLSACTEDKWELGRAKGGAWYKALETKFEEPWDGFRSKVLNKLGGIFVSRPPRKNATGEAHKETIYKKDEGSGSFEVRGGKTNKGDMFRMDIFKKGDKYVVVPIYISDVVDRNRRDIFYPQSPKRKETAVIDSSYQFLMTLHKDDYVKIKTRDGGIFEGYLVKVNASPAQTQFIIRNHDNSAVFLIDTKKFGKGELIKYENKIYKVTGFNNETGKLMVECDKE